MSLLEKTRELPEPLHSFFWSDEPRFLCEEICFLYGVPEELTGEVSWFVAPLLVKSFPIANLPQELRAKLPNVSEGAVFGVACELNKRILAKFSERFPEAGALLSEWEKKKTEPALSEDAAHRKMLEAESWYIEWKRENEREETPLAAEKEKAPTVVSLPLLDALAKYQKLSEQNVTEDRIVVKGESQPVRGSLRNWIRHYRDEVGIRKHSAMERGQFLFQGENTKRLSALDREHLSLVFRSIDENMPLSIDVERQEIVFPAFEEGKSAEGVAKTPAVEAKTPVIGTTFRPTEPFPAKATPIQKALEWKGKESNESEKRVFPPKTPREAPPAARVGVSAPVYGFPSAPFGEASASPISLASPAQSPFSPSEKKSVESRGNSIAQAAKEASPSPSAVSFSSSHILPNEKEQLIREESKAPTSPRAPEAVQVIRPRGDQFGLRKPSFDGKS